MSRQRTPGEAVMIVLLVAFAAAAVFGLHGCGDTHIVAIKTYPEQSLIELRQAHVPCRVLTLKVTPVERIYSDGSIKRTAIETLVGYNRC